MVDTERTALILGMAMRLEYYGIIIDDIKQESCTEFYFTVPESSTLYDETADEEFNTQLKTSEGLTQIAKELITNMIICTDSENFIPPEVAEEIKANKSEFVRFYVKVRVGDIWTNERGDEMVKAASERIKAAVEETKAKQEYKKA